MKARSFVTAAVLSALALTPPQAAAQSRASTFIEAARAQFDEFGYDSAYALLQRGLDPAAGASLAERQRGLVLLSIVALLRSNGQDQLGARQAMEQALRVNPAWVLPDSLAGLHSDAGRTYAEARLLVPLPSVAAPPAEVAPLTVTVDMQPDITLAVDSGRYRIETTPNRASRVVVQVSPADVPSEVLFADTQLVRGTAFRSWNLRGRDGAVVHDGRYAVRVRAVDTASVVSGTIERILVVSRVSVDTTPHPVPLAASAFLPETLRLKRASPAVLLVGVGFGAAAYMLPTALGNTQLNSGRSGDGTSIAVAGLASIAGIYGFLSGSRTRASPENARTNAQRRAQYETERADVTRRNRAAMAAAPVRVRVEQ